MSGPSDPPYMKQFDEDYKNYRSRHVYPVVWVIAFWISLINHRYNEWTYNFFPPDEEDERYFIAFYNEPTHISKNYSFISEQDSKDVFESPSFLKFESERKKFFATLKEDEILERLESAKLKTPVDSESDSE